MEHSKIVKYADDAFIYFDSNDFQIIESSLAEDIQSLSCWLKENELLINLNKGKTESVIFGTSQKISKLKSPVLEIQCNGTDITSTTTYKYLGVNLDPTLLLSNYFDRCYKKASSRVNLLGKLRYLLDRKAALAIYNSLVVPTLIYCSLVNLNLTNTQKSKLLSLGNRTARIIQNKSTTKVLVASIDGLRRSQACLFVRKCIRG